MIYMKFLLFMLLFNIYTAMVHKKVIEIIWKSLLKIMQKWKKKLIIYAVLMILKHLIIKFIFKIYKFDFYIIIYY